MTRIVDEVRVRDLRRRAVKLSCQNVERTRREGQIIEETLRYLDLWETDTGKGGDALDCDEP